MAMQEHIEGCYILTNLVLKNLRGVINGIILRTSGHSAKTLGNYTLKICVFYLNPDTMGTEAQR